MASFMMGRPDELANSYYEIQFRPATTNYQYGIFAPGQLEGQSQTDLEPWLAL